MNKIFRVVWSHATQSWVAVSELTSAKGKTKSKTARKLTALAVASGSALLAGNAFAATATITSGLPSSSNSNANFVIRTDGGSGQSVGNASATSEPVNVIYIGNGGIPRNIGDEAVVIGNALTGQSTGSVADTLIGNRIRSGGGGQDSLSTAVGYGAQVSGPSVSIGIGVSTDIGDSNGAAAVAQGAVGIGSFARTSGSANGGVAVGTLTSADQTNSTAIGTLAGVTTLGYDREPGGSGGGGVLLRLNEANGDTLTSLGAKAGARTQGGIAVGSNATTSRIDSNNAVAMGTNSAAIKAGSIALGNEALGGGYIADDKNTLTSQQSSYQTITNTQRTRLLEKVVKANANPTAENKFELASALAFLDRAQLATDRATVDLTQIVAADNAATTNAMAMGNQARAVNANAQAVGASAIARGANSTATGYNSAAMGTDSIASGNGAVAGLTAADKATYDTYVTAGRTLTSAANTLAAANENYNYTLGNLGAAATTALTTAGTNVNDMAAVAALTDSNLSGLAAAAQRVVNAQSALSTAQEAFDTAKTAADALAPVANALAQGRSAVASGVSSIAQGNTATASDDSAVAIGNNAKATEDYAIALGRNSTASAQFTIAMGNTAIANQNFAVALGNQAQATIASGVALGASSQTTVNSGVAGFNPVSHDSDTRSNTYAGLANRALTSTLAGVSVGSATNTRQINHVAAGTADDDAVNVAQLRSVNLKIAGNTAGQTESAKGTGYDTSSATSKDNVLLDSQTLSVVSSKTGLLTTDATNNTITITPVEGAVTADTTNTGAVTGSTAGLMTAEAVAAAINASGWKVAAQGVNGTELVNPGDTVTFIAGKNMAIERSGANITYKTLDDVNFNSVQFGDNGPKIQADGSNIKVGSNTDAPVSITNVANNLTAPSATATSGTSNNPTTSNAATVGDVLNAGWNLQQEGTAKDFVRPYDTVNFKNGNGTTVEITNTDGKTSDIQVHVKPADSSITVNTDGVKVNTGNGLETTDAGVQVKAGNNITVDENGVSVDTGSITPASDADTSVANAGTVSPNTGDSDKVATVANVANAINSAFWKATSGKEGTGATTDDNTTTVEAVKAGETVTFIAGDNLKIKQAGQNFTYSVNPVLTNLTSAEFKTTGDNPVTTNITGNGMTITPSAQGSSPVSLTNTGLDNGNNQIVNVAAGAQTFAEGTAKTAGLIDSPSSTATNAATVGDLANLGWVVSADNTTTDAATGRSNTTAYDAQVRNANEVKFVGKGYATVSGATDADGVRTITVTVGQVGAGTVNADGTVTATEDGLVTATQVETLVNGSGWNTNSTTATGGAKNTLINSGKNVNFEAGKNMTVTQAVDDKGNVSYTYATKDDVDFNSVNLGAPVTYTDADGNTLVKVGDNYYKPEQLENGAPKAGETPVDASTVKASPAPVNLTTKAATPATNNGTQPTTALDISSNNNPTQLTGVGSVLNKQDVPTAPTGSTGAAGSATLVDLNGTTENPVNPNAAATVGDLQNMGWVVSAKDNGYTDVVKNANEVRFESNGLATVTGQTVTEGDKAIRTITVDVNAQRTVEAAQNPVVYTDADGNKVTILNGEFYPEGTTLNAAGNPVDENGNAVQPLDKGTITASMNSGDNNVDTPVKLGNVANNLPTVNDAENKAYSPDGSQELTTGNKTKAPLTAAQAADLLNPDSDNFVGNNAATVSDVLNAGWNLQGNGKDVDFVKPYDTVNFVDGDGTTVEVSTTDNQTNQVKVNVKSADTNTLTVDANGVKVNTGTITPVTADDAANNRVSGQVAPTAGDENKVATVGDVANAINAAAWKATSAATAAGELGKDATVEQVKAGDTVTFEADKNIKVTQDGQKFTFATKDDVAFNTVALGNPNTTTTYATADGTPVYQTGTDAQGNPIYNTAADGSGTAVPASDVTATTTSDPVVNMTTKKATPATNNGTAPSNALDITSSDNTPTQITGVGSVLNVAPQTTRPDGNATTGDARPNLVNLGTKAGDTALSEGVLNSAATVRDLTNMGWVVSSNKTTGALANEYSDVVKNANEVRFLGTGLATVSGKTEGNVRTITVDVSANGVVAGTDANSVTNGNALMTAQAVANAIKASGFTLKTSAATGGTKVSGSDEVINPGKVVDMTAGKNMTVTQGENGKVTYATKDDVEFNSVKLGDTVQGGKQAVNLTNEAATPANNNSEANTPSTALNITSADGKPTQIKGVASSLNTTTIATAPQGSAGENKPDVNLVDLNGSTANPVNPNAAATVGDLQNMGWVVAADGNQYVDTVKNANRVEFKSGEGISVTGNTNAEGTREITVAIKTGTINSNPNGSASGTNGGFVTDNQVSDAINKASWNLVAAGTDGSAQIRPTNTVTFDAGKNMQVVRDGANITYSTTDNPEFNTVKLGDVTLQPVADNNGNNSIAFLGNITSDNPRGETKITNVADGDISPESTDAVNGRQIFALTGGNNTTNVSPVTVNNADGTTTTYNNVVVDADGNPILKTYNVEGQKEIITNSVVEAIHNMNEQGIKFFHSNDGVARPKAERENNYDSSASGSYATAIGSRSSAEGTNAVAIGVGSVVSGNDSISIGTGNQVIGNNSGAFGDPSIINGNSSYSVGNNNTVATDNTFVLGNEVTRTAANSVFLGTQSGYVEANTNADGSINTATSTTAGTKALTQQVTGGVLNQYAGGQEGEVVGVVSVGTVGQDANGNTVQQTRRVQNVAPGLVSEKSTDAINGSQLYSVASRLGDINNRINRNNKDLRAGIAGANAAAGLPQVYIPGKSMVAASAGTFKGQSALAVGYSRASDNGKVILKLQGNANTRGDIGGSVGVGYQW